MALETLKAPFRPKWDSIRSPSENVHLNGTQAQRVFSPATGVHVDNELLGEPEILLGGWENGRAAVKVYQPETDRYSRAFIPQAAMSAKRHNNVRSYLYQGMGADGGILAIAGGAENGEGSLDIGKQPSKRVVLMDAKTKKVSTLPDMKEGRVSPIVTASPDGQYVLVAGGYARPEGSYMKQLKTVEIYDRKAGEWIDVEAKFPGLGELPVARFGGSAVWLQSDNGKHNQIVIAGGSSNWQGSMARSEPTQQIDMYSDGCKASWSASEMVTPRMLPALAKRELGDGCQQVVIAGGGTGVTSYSAQVDPQIYSVELLDPKTGNISFGQHLPEQPGIRTGAEGARGAVDWGGNALVFVAGRKSPCAAADATTSGFLFGFSRAFQGKLGAPIADDGAQQQV